jgi:hypothetical protein
MTKTDPPRLAVALLHRCLHDHEPLAGDLLERFARGQSRVWFWRQVLYAIVIHLFQSHDAERPLGLADQRFFVPAADGRIQQPRRVNLTASPLPHIGGLGLAALSGLVLLVRPEAGWLFVPALAGGVAFGLTLAMIRRRALLADIEPSDQAILHVKDMDGSRLEE